MQEQVRRSLRVVLQMLEELRWAEACLFLFQLHKNHFQEWQDVKNALLLHSGVNPSILATILECSTKDDLATSSALVPGLSRYSGIARTTDSFDLLD